MSKAKAEVITSKVQKYVEAILSHMEVTAKHTLWVETPEPLTPEVRQKFSALFKKEDVCIDFWRDAIFICRPKAAYTSCVTLDYLLREYDA